MKIQRAWRHKEESVKKAEGGTVGKKPTPKENPQFVADKGEGSKKATQFANSTEDQKRKKKANRQRIKTLDPEESATKRPAK